MKKILISIVMMSACTLWGETIKRVTYFPIPYVAYSRAEAEKLDLCLDGEACEVRLGSAACTTGTCPVPLTVSSMMVSSALTLQGNNNQYIESTTINLGSTALADGKLGFGNLRLGSDVEVGSLGTTNMNISSLNLFGYDFPPCGADANKIQWAQVSTTNAEGEEEEAHYLVCGDVTDPTCQNEPPSKTKSEACGTGYTGYRNYTWQDYPTCDWTETSNNCEPVSTKKYFWKEMSYSCTSYATALPPESGNPYNAAEEYCTNGGNVSFCFVEGASCVSSSSGLNACGASMLNVERYKTANICSCSQDKYGYYSVSIEGTKWKCVYE